MSLLKSVLRVIIPTLIATLVCLKPLLFQREIIRYGIRKHCVSWEDIVNNKTHFPWYQHVYAVTIHTEKNFTNTMISNEGVVSNDKLDYLLFKYGVDSSGMDIKNIQQKINLLLQVSSPDFWAKNYRLHPKALRMSGFAWGHREYLAEIAAVVALRDRNELKQRFPRVATMLSGHSSMEEQYLFEFMRENAEKFDFEDFELINDLTNEHSVIHLIVDRIMEDLNNNTLDGEEYNAVSDELIDLMEQWDKNINIHFLKEDQNLVRLWINMDIKTYHKFHYSLDYHFLKHLVSSGIFIYGNKIRNIFKVEL
eukprot:348269_1